MKKNLKAVVLLLLASVFYQSCTNNDKTIETPKPSSNVNIKAGRYPSNFGISVSSPDGTGYAAFANYYDHPFEVYFSAPSTTTAASVDLYKDGNFYARLAENVPNDRMAKTFTLPSGIPHNVGGWEVKVTDTANPAVYGYSLAYFTIFGDAMIMPNGGESVSGVSGAAKWSTNVFNYPSNVRVELWKGGLYYKTLTASTENDGYYAKPFGYGAPAGSDYQIRISDVNYYQLYDISNTYFTIR